MATIITHLPISHRRWPWHFRARARLGINALRLGLWLLPPCRYRVELSQSLWILSLRVQTHVAVVQHQAIDED